MRNLRQKPQISAYNHIWGNFDFNKTPLAPLGTKAVIFEDPDTRMSWGPHSKTAWYIVEILKDSKTNLNLYLQPENYSALKRMTKIFNTASKHPPIELKPLVTPELKITSLKETETET